MGLLNCWHQYENDQVAVSITNISNPAFHNSASNVLNKQTRYFHLADINQYADKVNGYLYSVQK